MAKRVIVIGSGIIGASIAYHLAKRGAEVTVIEAEETGRRRHPRQLGVDQCQLGQPRALFPPAPALDRALAQAAIGDSATRHRLVRRADLGPAAGGARRLCRRARPVGPTLCARWTAARSSRWSPTSGPFRITATSRPAKACWSRWPPPGCCSRPPRALGADVLAETRVKWLAEEHGRVVGVMTDEGVIHADETVVAAGASTAQLLDSVGLTFKMTAPAGLLSHSKPAPKLLNGLVMTPGLHIRQTAEGRIVAGTDFAGADPEGNAEGLAAELQAKVEAMVAGAEGLGLDFFTVGYRPTPADGFSAIGRPHEQERALSRRHPFRRDAGRRPRPVRGAANSSPARATRCLPPSHPTGPRSHDHAAPVKGAARICSPG